MRTSVDLLEGEELTSLTEVVIKGMQSSADALSGMTGRKIGIKPLYIGFASLRDIPFLASNPDDGVVGIYLLASGGMNGHIMLLFPLESAYRLVDALLGRWDEGNGELGEMELSALGEVGNVTGSFFLNKLAEATNMCIHPSPPAVMVDMAGAILDVILAEVAQKVNKCLLIETAFEQDDSQIEGLLLVVPEPESLDTILEALR